MSIDEVSTFAHNAVKFQGRPLVYIDVGADALFCNREILSCVVDRDGANAVRVHAVIGLEVLAGQVVGLVLVTSDEDDDIVLQEIHIISFVGMLAHHAEEAHIAP